MKDLYKLMKVDLDFKNIKSPAILAQKWGEANIKPYLRKSKPRVIIYPVHPFNDHEDEIRHRVKWKFPIVVGTMIFGTIASYTVYQVFGPRPLPEQRIKYREDEYY